MVRVPVIRQSLNAYFPIESTEGEFIVTETRFEQSWKAHSPIEVPDEGRKVTDRRLSLFKKAYLAIDFKEEGNTTESIILFTKHHSPIEVTDRVAIFNDFKLVQATKA